MKQSIQEPVVTDVQELVKEFGSHYVFQHPEKLGSTKLHEYIVIQRIGPKSEDWAHEYSTVDEAIKSGQDTILKNAQKQVEKFENASKQMSSKFLFFKSKLGLLDSATQTKLNDYLEEIDGYKSIIEHPHIKIPVKLLEGQFNIPKYRLVKDQEVYVVKFYNMPKVTVEKGFVSDNTIYDYRGSSSNNREADRYDFRFSTYIQESDGDNNIASLEFERLISFNGKYWETSMLNCYIFLDKKEADDFILGVYKEHKRKLDEYSEIFEKEIDKKS